MSLLRSFPDPDKEPEILHHLEMCQPQVFLLSGSHEKCKIGFSSKERLIPTFPQVRCAHHGTLPYPETYIKVRSVKSYIWFIMDSVSRSIIGYTASMDRSVDPCIQAMRQAFQKLKKPPPGRIPVCCKLICNGHCQGETWQWPLHIRFLIYAYLSSKSISNPNCVKSKPCASSSALIISSIS